MNSNDFDPELGDWRLGAATRLAKDLPASFPGGPSHVAGTPVRTAIVTSDISFHAPSATALALNIAMKASLQGEAMRPELQSEPSIGPTGFTQSVADKDAAQLFDFFEQCLVTVVFSFQALESFCNYTIGREVKGTLNIKVQRTHKLLTGPEIERLSTDDKLGQVLPILLKVQTPKGRKQWQDYDRLKTFRDLSVHFKALAQYPHAKGVPMEEADNALFVRFYHEPPAFFPCAAIAMLDYLLASQSPPPRWMHEPLAFLNQHRHTLASRKP